MVWHQLERVQVDFEYQIQQNTSHNRKIPNVWAAGIAARESIKKNYMYTEYEVLHQKSMYLYVFQARLLTLTLFVHN